MTSRYRDDHDDESPRPRGGGLPTWLVVTLVVLLLFGLICAGSIAVLVSAGKTAIDEGASQYTREMLLMLSQQVKRYYADNQYYPSSLAEIRKLDPNGFAEYLDYRDQENGVANLVYLPAYSNAAPQDILAHTRRNGPLPILAVRMNGQLVEFESTRDLDLALITQQTRPLPDEEPFVPPTESPPPAPPPLTPVPDSVP